MSARIRMMLISGLLIGLEVALLFAALFFTLQPIPSNIGESFSFLPGGAFAITLFATSRLLRWRNHGYVIAVPETAAFALFAWVSVRIANELLKI